jgi:serine/threonine protein kinase
MSPHPSIARLIAAAEGKSNLYLITEYCDGGELFDVVEENGAPNEDTARVYFAQIVSGLKHLRDAGIAHRDLSPENILLKNNLTECKIM